MKTIPETGSFGVMTSHNHTASPANSPPKQDTSVSLYQKCLSCPDYGVSCNGPKLAALGDIMVVRDFHRAIRNQRSIPMKLVYFAAQPISESTINDYFSHSEKDFKWTTVGCIDNALTAICGNRVGQPLLDHPCPASSTDIQDKINSYESQLDALRLENHNLQQKLTEANGKIITSRNEVKADYASRVQFLKDLCEKLRRDMDELNEKHAKELLRMDSLAANYLARIDEKNVRMDRKNRSLRWLAVCLSLSLIVLACYIVWDIVHPAAGFITY